MFYSFFYKAASCFEHLRVRPPPCGRVLLQGCTRYALNTWMDLVASSTKTRDLMTRIKLGCYVQGGSVNNIHGSSNQIHVLRTRIRVFLSFLKSLKHEPPLYVAYPRQYAMPCTIDGVLSNASACAACPVQKHNPRPRSLRRALLTPQVHPGSWYGCGKKYLRAACGLRREEKGLKSALKTILAGTAATRTRGCRRS